MHSGASFQDTISKEFVKHRLEVAARRSPTDLHEARDDIRTFNVMTILELFFKSYPCIASTVSSRGQAFSNERQEQGQKLRTEGNDGESVSSRRAQKS